MGAPVWFYTGLFGRLELHADRHLSLIWTILLCTDPAIDSCSLPAAPGHITCCCGVFFTQKMLYSERRAWQRRCYGLNCVAKKICGSSHPSISKCNLIGSLQRDSSQDETIRVSPNPYDSCPYQKGKFGQTDVHRSRIM